MKAEDIKALSEQYATPFYLFEEDVLKKRILYLKSFLPDAVSLCYAVKANTFLTPYMSGLVERFEVCSPGELAICINQKIPYEKLVISGVYKTPDVIKKSVLSHGSAGYYTVESISQLELLKSAALEAGEKIKVLLRLTSGNQFGLNQEEIENIIQTQNGFDCIEICGIQYFSGTQKKSIKKYKRELSYLDCFIKELKTKYAFTTAELEYGTGFPVSYFEGEEWDEAAFLSEFCSVLESMEYSGRITLEIGRSLVASCGCFVTKAVDIKQNATGNYAIVDGGINHLAYYGQMMAMKHPFMQHIPARENDVKHWNICGSLCTTNDILVKDVALSDLRLGDLFVFKNTGAYCPMEGISLFLSRDLPAVLMCVSGGSVNVLRKHKEIYHLNHSYLEG